MEHRPHIQTAPDSASLQVQLAQAEQRAAAQPKMSAGEAAMEQLRLHCLREKVKILLSAGTADTPPNS